MPQAPLTLNVRKQSDRVGVIDIHGEMTGYAEDAFQRHLPKGEDFQFLPKPFSLKELATMVKTTLEAPG